MLLNKKKCPLCNSKNVKFSYTSIKDKIDYSYCKNCTLYFQTKIHSLSNKDISKFYTKNYFIKGYADGSIAYFNRSKQYFLDKKYIKKFYKDNKRNSILDYGCGNGKFLKLFSGKKFGYEYNKNVKITSSIKTLSIQEIKKKKFDLIIMRGVIEHLKDVKKILSILTKCLKKNGVFIILATPNTLSYCFVKNKKAFNQNNERHLYHFNFINLTDIFMRFGLFNFDTSLPYIETPYVNFKENMIKLKKIKSIKNSPPFVGNMLSMAFKKF